MPTPILTPSQHNTLASRLFVADTRKRIDLAASYGAQAATGKTIITQLNEAEVDAVMRMALELDQHPYEMAAHYAFNKFR